MTHVDEWVTSRHAWYRVDCEKCHGGDAATSDQSAAHRGVVKSADPSSTVHRMALPSTCGRCHSREASAFARSTHRQLLSRGDGGAPTCTTCHSSMAADVPSPAALEKQCLSCHRDDPELRASAAKRQLEILRRLRTTLKRVKVEIAVMTNADRRASLSTEWAEADMSIRDVAASIHAFDLRRVEERLNASTAQIERLVVEVARR